MAKEMSKPPTPLPPDTEKVLAVEGIDEEMFFACLLEEMRIKGVEIRSVVGKNNFNTTLPALVKEFQSSIKQFAIIRDADESVENSFRSLQAVLQKEETKTARGESLVIPDEAGFFKIGAPSVGIFVLPDNQSSSALEDLCLDLIPTDRLNEKTCAETFLKCLPDEPKKHKHSKIVVQAYLAAMHKKAGDQPKEYRIISSIGIGAKRKCWDFNAPSFEPLKQFLEAFR